MTLGQNIPLFFRLYHKLKQDIIRGEIPRGTKIPTIEEIARQHGISQSSVRKSLDILEEEGLLYRKQGWGTIVPENLELRFYDLGRLINSKKIFSEMSRADIEVTSNKWVPLSPRLDNILYDGAALDSDQMVHNIDARLFFPGKLKFKALVTFHLTRMWFDETKMDDSTSPREILLRMSQWILTSSVKMKEAILPCLCTDDSAKFLKLPDGTPVFHHTVSLTSQNRHSCCCWEMISTANIFARELSLK